MVLLRASLIEQLVLLQASPIEQMVLFRASTIEQLMLLRASPFSDWKLSNFQFVVIKNIVNASHYMLSLNGLNAASVALVPRMHLHVGLTIHESSYILYNISWIVLRNICAPPSANTFSAINES